MTEKEECSKIYKVAQSIRERVVHEYLVSLPVLYYHDINGYTRFYPVEVQTKGFPVHPADYAMYHSTSLDQWQKTALSWIIKEDKLTLNPYIEGNCLIFGCLEGKSVKRNELNTRHVK